jgi:hypothetical protein
MVQEEEKVFVGTQLSSLYALLHTLAQHPFNALQHADHVPNKKTSHT